MKSPLHVIIGALWARVKALFPRLDGKPHRDLSNGLRGSQIIHRALKDAVDDPRLGFDDVVANVRGRISREMPWWDVDEFAFRQNGYTWIMKHRYFTVYYNPMKQESPTEGVPPCMER